MLKYKRDGKLIWIQIINSEALTLHLVLTPATDNLILTPVSPSQVLEYALNENSTPHFPQIPASTTQLSAPLQTNGSQPTPHNVAVGGAGQHAQTQGQTVLQGQLPQQQVIDQANQHFVTITQQLVGQAGPGGINPTLGVQQQIFPGQTQHVFQQPIQHTFQQHQQTQQPSFQQILTQQQRARAAAGIPGIGHNLPPNNAVRASTPASQQPNQATNGDPNSASYPQALPPGTSNTVVREGQGPNGSHWRMIINHNMAVPPVQVPQGSGQQQRNGNRTQSDSQTPTLTTLHSTGPTAISPDSSRPVPMIPNMNPDPSARFLEQLSGLESRTNIAIAPLEQEILVARHLLEEMLLHRPDLRGQAELHYADRLNTVAIQAATIRARLSGGTNQIPMLPTLPSQQAQTTASQQDQNPAGYTVFLLLSPNGPHAVLTSPTGIWTSPSAQAEFNRVVQAQNTGPQVVQQQTTNLDPVQHPDPLHQHPNQERLQRHHFHQVNAQHPPAPAAAVQAQPDQLAQQHQARDLIRVLLPLGGHLWLLIRLFGFVYFFTNGAGWRRTVLLGLCAVVVFIIQTGVLRPLHQGLWEPVRRHIEGLVPLAGNNAAGAPAEDQAANRQGQGVVDHVNGQPSPGQAAQRFLRERDARDASTIRGYLRRWERAIAIFVASLVPGVGERHIAAREAAEAVERALQAAEREREETQRRAAEAAREEHEEGLNHDTVQGDANNAHQRNEGATTSSLQPPLVEI